MLYDEARLCADLCSLTEYGFGAGCREGAITKSLKALREFLG